MKFKIIVFLIMAHFFLHTQDSINVRNDTLKQPIIDSVASSNNFKETENFSFSWYDKNQTVFWTFIFSTLTALIVLLLSFFLNSRHQKKLRLLRYSGILFSIYADFSNHDVTIELLSKELDEILRISKENNTLIAYSPLVIIPIEFLDNCRLKLLEFDDFNSDIVAILSGYIASTNMLNSQTDLKQLSDLKSLSKSNSNFMSGVESYINALKDHIGKLNFGRKNLKDKIVQEIENIPFKRYYFDETNKILRELNK